MDDRCCHETVHLAHALVIDQEVACPKHRGAFDNRTDRAIRVPPRIDLKAFETRIENGMINMRTG